MIGEGEVVVLEFLFDVELVELVVDGVVCLLGDGEEGVGGVLESLLLLLLLLQQLLELSHPMSTSSFYDLSARSRFIVSYKFDSNHLRALMKIDQHHTEEG